MGIVRNMSPVTREDGGIGMNHTTFQSCRGKTIFFVRHAEAHHNPTKDYRLKDPMLTASGVEQALRIRQDFPVDALANVELIVCSPMKRTLQTCQLAFGQQINWRGVRVELLSELQECGGLPCDIGSPVSELADSFPAFTDEISKLSPDWHSKSGLNDTTHDAASEKAQFLKQWLLKRPENVIIVISHGGTLRGIFDGTVAFENAQVVRCTLQPDRSIILEAATSIESSYDDEINAVGDTFD